MGGEGRTGVRAFSLVTAVLMVAVVAGCESTDGAIDGDGEGAATTESGATQISTETASETPAAATSTGEDTSAGESAVTETSAVGETTTETDTEEETEAVTEASPPEADDEEEPARFEDVIVVSDFATFTTPAQAAYCIISGPTTGAASISCEVAQSSVPPGESLMGICASEGIGWFFNFFADSGHGGFFCNHVDGITRGGGNPHYWQDDPWIDPNNVVTLPSGARVAVLDYGRVMRAGDMDCTVQPDGLTCWAQGSGRGFTVNSASYTNW